MTFFRFVAACVPAGGHHSPSIAQHALLLVLKHHAHMCSNRVSCFPSVQVGTIRLASFNARALRDVSAALDQLQQRGATELVLDLRDNRWGQKQQGHMLLCCRFC
jgi:hypothetical protein